MFPDQKAVVGAGQLFAVGARLLGIYIAYATLRYLPMAFIGPYTRELAFGIAIPMVTGLLFTWLLLFRTESLARWIGIRADERVEVFFGQSLLAVGIVLVGIYGLITSSFAIMSMVLAVMGQLQLPPWDFVIRGVPIFVSLIAIFAAGPISRLLLQLGWDEAWPAEQTRETESV